MEWILDGDGEEEQMEMGWIRRPEAHTGVLSVRSVAAVRCTPRHSEQQWQWLKQSKK